MDEVPEPLGEPGQPDDRAPTDERLDAELSLPERLLPGARVQFRIENLADVRYRQIAGFAAPGRTLYAGLKLHR